MARETRIICDCCGDDLTDGRYYIKVKPHWTSRSGAVVFAEDEEHAKKIAFDCIAKYKAEGEGTIVL